MGKNWLLNNATRMQQQPDRCAITSVLEQLIRPASITSVPVITRRTLFAVMARRLFIFTARSLSSTLRDGNTDDK